MWCLPASAHPRGPSSPGLRTIPSCGWSAVVTHRRFGRLCLSLAGERAAVAGLCKQNSLASTCPLGAERGLLDLSPAPTDASGPHSPTGAAALGGGRPGHGRAGYTACIPRGSVWEGVVAPGAAGAWALPSILCSIATGGGWPEPLSDTVSSGRRWPGRHHPLCWEKRRPSARVTKPSTEGSPGFASGASLPSLRLSRRSQGRTVLPLLVDSLASAWGSVNFGDPPGPGRPCSGIFYLITGLRPPRRWRVCPPLAITLSAGGTPPCSHASAEGEDGNQPQSGANYPAWKLIKCLLGAAG